MFQAAAVLLPSLIQCARAWAATIPLEIEAAAKGGGKERERLGQRLAAKTTAEMEAAAVAVG